MPKYCERYAKLPVSAMRNFQFRIGILLPVATKTTKTRCEKTPFSRVFLLLQGIIPIIFNGTNVLK